MAGALEQVSGAFSAAFELIGKKTRQLYINMLWLEAIGALIGGAVILLLAAIALVFLSSSLPAIANFLASGGKGAFPSLGEGFLPAALLASVVVVAALLLQVVVMSVGYNIVEATAAGRKADIKSQLEKNLVPVATYQAAYFLALLVLATPAIVSFAMLKGGMTFVLCGLAIISGLAVIVFAFLAQFAIPEIVIGGKSLVPAIQTSARKAMANLFAVILLDLALGLIGFAVGGFSDLLQGGVDLGTDALAVGVPGADMVWVAINSILKFVISILIEAALAMVVYMVVYLFWKGLKETAS